MTGLINTPARINKIVRIYGANIDGLDFSIYGKTTELIRSVNSINEKSGLYAIPLSLNELSNLSSSQILELATKPRFLSDRIWRRNK